MTHESIKTRVVGVDIQIDTTTLAVIDVRGDILAREEFATGTNPNIGDFSSMLSEHVVSLVEGNGGNNYYEEEFLLLNHGIMQLS